MFTIIAIVVVLAILSEFFGSGGSSSSHSSSKRNTSTLRKQSTKPLDLKPPQVTQPKLASQPNSTLYPEYLNLKRKFTYYQELVDKYKTFPLLSHQITFFEIYTINDSFPSKLKFEKSVNGLLRLYGVLGRGPILNYDEVKDEFEEIKSFILDLDNLFSKEVRKKTRDYVMRELNKYGVNTINHMTHIDNLSAILENGLLAHNNPYRKKDISNQGVNARRERLEPIYNRKVHDYVPFYLNVKNSMLYVVQKQQEDNIIILGFSPDILFTQNTLFTDRNASTNMVRFSDNFYDLGNNDFIDLDRVFNLSHQPLDKNLKNIMQAEILVPEKVYSDELLKIYVQNAEVRKFILEKFESKLKQNNIEVVINEELFF